jgi:hypothetical protein
MKITKLGQVVRLAVQSSTLLAVAFFSFQAIECSDNNRLTQKASLSSNRQNQPVAQTWVSESDNYRKTITKEPLDPKKNVQPSVGVKSTQFADGTILEVTTTVQVSLSEGLVVTTVEELRKHDYEKVVEMGTNIAVQLANLAHENRSQIAKLLKRGTSAVQNVLNNSLDIEGIQANRQNDMLISMLGQYLNNL